MMIWDTCIYEQIVLRTMHGTFYHHTFYIRMRKIFFWVREMFITVNFRITSLLSKMFLFDKMSET